mgnify:FL=1
MSKYKILNFIPKKHLGQNFLVDKTALEKIIAAAALNENDFVVEVGAGLGVLTVALAEKVKQVRAIEYDKRLIPILKKTFQNHQNIELVEADALRVKLPFHSYKLVANIPYYITSPLINHFLQPKTAEEKCPALIVLLVQKEVAEKICAKDGQHSILSLQTQIFGKPSIVGRVHKSSFNPKPKVDSAILKIEVYNKPLIQNTEAFFKLIGAAFSQKRKTLLNSLKNGLKLDKELNKETVAAFLKKAGISPTRRPQTLTMGEWNALCESKNAKLLQ